jgi:diguanylate cyclase
VELTERVFIDEHDEATATIADLSRRGVRLVLDDFGTGYSALASLERFPLHALKMDRLFIDSIANPDNDAPIIGAVIALGRALGLLVIGEGVETETQLAYLRALGCDAVQGYLLGRPQASTAASTRSSQAA